MRVKRHFRRPSVALFASAIAGLVALSIMPTSVPAQPPAPPAGNGEGNEKAGDEPQTVPANRAVTVAIEMPGRWHQRPLGSWEEPWNLVGHSPGTLTFDAGQEIAVDIPRDAETDTVREIADLRIADRIEFVNASGCRSLDAESFFAILAKLPNLRALDVSHGGMLGAFHSQSLHLLSRLEFLNVSGTLWLHEPQVERIAAVKTLRELLANSCPMLTGKGLRHFAAHPNLRTLGMMGCEEFDEANLAHLAGLPLTNLYLGGEWPASEVSDAGLAHIAKLETLEVLDLNHCDGITAAGAAKLAALKKLRILDLAGTSIADTGFGFLAELSALGKVTLPRTAGDGALAALAGKTTLREVIFDGCENVTDTGAAHLATLSNLIRLDAAKSKITDAGIAKLAGLAHVRELSLAECAGITAEGIGALAALKQLRTLSLKKTAVTDAALAVVRELPALASLDISYCPALTDACFDHLIAIADLESIDIAGNRWLTGARLGEFLLAHPRITNLRLTGTGIESLKLTGVPTLRKLYVSHCNIRAVELANLPGLTTFETHQGWKLERVALRGLPAVRSVVVDAGYDSELTVEMQRLPAVGSFECDGAVEHLHLAEMAQLKSLAIDGSNLRTLKMAELPALEKISISYARYYLAGIEVGELPAMKQLFIREGGAIDDAEFSALVTAMPALETLGIYDAGELTAEALAPLANCRQLRTVKLARSPAVTTAGIAHLAELPALQSLAVTLQKQADFAVTGMATLQSLEISETVAYSAKPVLAAVKITDLPALQTLMLRRCEAIAAFELAGTPALRNLNLAGSHFDDDSIPDLAQFPALRELNVGGSAITGLSLAGFAHFETLHASGCPHLMALVLRELPALQSVSATGNAAMKRLEIAKSPGLKTLEITDARALTEFAVDAKELPALETLFFRDTAVESLDLSGAARLTMAFVTENRNLKSLTLAEHPQLAHLTVYGCDELDRVNLSGCAGLERLCLWLPKLSAIDLPSMPKLIVLELDGTNIRQLDLAGLPQLESLKLARTPIEALDLRPLPALVTIDVGNCANLSSEKLTGLESLQNLRVISMNANAWVDGEFLRRLHTIRTLKSIEIERCQSVSAEDLATLRAALPECRVRHR